MRRSPGGRAEAIFYLYSRLFTNNVVPGQADLMVFLGIITSIMLLIMALQFKVINRIYDCIRNQPTYLVAELEIEDL